PRTPTPVLAAPLPEPLERRFCSNDARPGVLLRWKAVLLEVEATDEEGQRKPLDHECSQKDRKGEEDDEFAARERGAGVRREWDRERGGERDGSAHAHPRDHGLVPARSNREH